MNTYFVSWAARQAGLKVALSGLGSNEIFGGYTSFHATSTAARMAALGRCVPKRLRVPFASAIASAGSAAASPDALRKACAAFLDPGGFPHPYFFTRLLFTPRIVASAMKADPSRRARGRGSDGWPMRQPRYERRTALQLFRGSSCAPTSRMFCCAIRTR